MHCKAGRGRSTTIVLCYLVCSYAFAYSLFGILQLDKRRLASPTLLIKHDVIDADLLKSVPIHFNF